MVHSVKCYPDHFKALKDGSKPFDVRKKDRLYETGDHLAINEFVPTEQVDPYSLNVGLRQTSGGYYTGDSLLYKITFILDDPQYCKPDTVILGLARCEI